MRNYAVTNHDDRAYQNIEMHRRHRRSSRRRRQRLLRTWAISGMLVILILCSVFAMNANAKTIEQDTPMYKYYTSVQIMNGDSLWSIADTYTDGSVSEILDCIEEIKSINHLSRFEKIKAGEFLIVPYYSADIL